MIDTSPGKLPGLQKNEYNLLLICIDIDGTLNFDDLFHRYCKGIRNSVNLLATDHFSIGINTSRPEKSAMGYYRHLGCNGPLITENGGRYYVPGIGFTQSMEEGSEAVVADIKKILIATATSYKFKFVSNPEKLFSNSLFSNPDRVCTLSIHLSPNIPQKHAELFFGTLRGKIQSCFPGKIDVIWSDLERKIFIEISGNDKFKTLEMIRDKYYPSAEVFLIGDNERGNSPKIKLAAVKNASRAMKKKSDLISSKNGAAGVLEIINILKNERESKHGTTSGDKRDLA